MFMRVMLIGLLVIGTVSMLETDVYARCCFGCSMLCMQVILPEKSEKMIAKVVAEVVAEVKKHDDSGVYLIGFTDQVGRAADKEFGRVEGKIEDVRQRLTQGGLRPDIIRPLILEGYAPRDPKRRGIKVIVTWPNSEKDKR
jgi:hypothetical protein